MPSVSLWLTKQPITSRFGPRKGFSVPHKGVDFAFSRGAGISAWGAGEVVAAGKHPEYGYYVRIKHAEGIETSYHSMKSKPPVKLGQRVAMYQIIGYAGSSAMGATGPHLHGGLWLGGQPVDALAHLQPGAIRTVAYGASLAAITIDGVFGPQSIRRLQTILGCFVDGVFGKQTVAALQAKLGVVIDGKFGKQTIRALQTRLGVVVDGVFGKQTIRALQTRLSVGSF